MTAIEPGPQKKVGKLEFFSCNFIHCTVSPTHISYRTNGIMRKENEYIAVSRHTYIRLKQTLSFKPLSLIACHCVAQGMRSGPGTPALALHNQLMSHGRDTLCELARPKDICAICTPVAPL